MSFPGARGVFALGLLAAALSHPGRVHADPSGAVGGKSEWIRGTAQATALAPRPGDDATTRELLSWYEAPATEFRWGLLPRGTQERVRVYEIEIESPVRTGIVENDTIRGWFYEPTIPVEGKRPGAVVLHHLGGEFTAEEMIGKALAENGVAAVFMYFPYYSKRWPEGRGPAPGLITDDVEHVKKGFRQAVLDAHRVGDWLAQRPDVDPDRLGLTGISLGAVVGSLTGGVDPRFRKLALVMAGGDLTRILLENEEVQDVKKKMQELGVTADALRETLRPIEPLSFAHRVDASNVLMINATDDEIVPKDCTRALWRGMGKPKVKWYKGGHYSIGIYVVDIVQQVARTLRSPVVAPGAPGADEDQASAAQPEDERR